MRDRGFPIARILLLVACVAPRGAAAAESPGPSEPRSLAIGGRSRSYRIYAPRTLPGNAPAALVLVFHGGDGDGAGAERLTGFSALAEREGFLVAYPDGVGKHWNDGRDFPDSEAYRENVDDVAFVSGLIDAISRERAVDPDRVFATGFSNGGIFAHYLAARLAGRIAAIAPVSGGIAKPFDKTFRPDRPVSVLIIHDVGDPLVPYHGGGVGPRRDHGQVIDTEEAARLWVAADGGSTKASPDRPPSVDPKNGCSIERSRWPGGRDATEVVLYATRGGGHTWPGGPQYAPQALVGRVCREFDATRTIWDFFREHARHRAESRP